MPALRRMDMWPRAAVVAAVVAAAALAEGEIGAPITRGGFGGDSQENFVHYGDNYICGDSGYWNDFVGMPSEGEQRWRPDGVGGRQDDEAPVICTPSIITLGSPRSGSHTLLAVLRQHPMLHVMPHESSFWAKANLAGKNESSIEWQMFLKLELREKSKPITVSLARAGARRAQHATNFLSHINRYDQRTDSIPRLIHANLPRVRLATAYRCAVERTWSHFNVFYDREKYGGDTHAEKFHNTVVAELGILRRCFRKHHPHSLEWAACAYGNITELSNAVPTRNLPHIGVADFPSNGYTMLRKSVYSLYWEVWLRHFPPNQFRVYSPEAALQPGSNDTESLLRYAFPDVPLPPEALQPRCVKSKNDATGDTGCVNGVHNAGWSKTPISMMRADTRALLEDFFSPFEARGCKLLPYTCGWFNQCRAKDYGAATP